jgi:hypothetical protein
MLHQALSTSPDLAVCHKAAQAYYLTMLTVLPNLHSRIDEHALLVHVPKILLLEPLEAQFSWKFSIKCGRNACYLKRTMLVASTEAD